MFKYLLIFYLALLDLSNFVYVFAYFWKLYNLAPEECMKLSIQNSCLDFIWRDKRKNLTPLSPLNQLLKQIEGRDFWGALATPWPIFLYQYIMVKYLSERSYLWNDFEIEFFSGLEKIFTRSSITVSVTSKGTGKVRHLSVQVDKGNKTRVQVDKGNKTR